MLMYSCFLKLYKIRLPFAVVVVSLLLATILLLPGPWFADGFRLATGRKNKGQIDIELGVEKCTVEQIQL